MGGLPAPDGRALPPLEPVGRVARVTSKSKECIMAMTRREFLRRAGVIGATLPVATSLIGCVDNPEIEEEPLPTYEHDGPLGPETLFEHGVASGDPTPSS